MARKIALVEPHGPKTYLKKSVAQLLVRRLLARWLVENESIELVDVRDLPNGTPARFVIPSKPYIPEKLPPAEVPGVRFIPPIRPEWTKLYSPSC